MAEKPASFLLDSLTQRESEVLQIMMAGMKNQDIVWILSLSIETVHWYHKQIYSKLGVHTRTLVCLKAQ
jgi:DNA-binding CsgD family transcriptional regulator